MWEVIVLTTVALFFVGALIIGMRLSYVFMRWNKEANERHREAIMTMQMQGDRRSAELNAHLRQMDLHLVQMDKKMDEMRLENQAWFKDFSTAIRMILERLERPPENPDY